MRTLITTFILVYFVGVSKGQIKNSNFISIDHIPIAVKNLDNSKKVFSDLLHFKVKNGKEHEGIKNYFIKFEDGTYLEFTTPIDSFQTIGKYYADFLKNRQGGTSLAISITNSDTLINYLNAKSIEYKTDSNRIWKTVEPKGIELFFIDYADKQWRDSKTNTTHLNTSYSLKSAYILSTDINLDVKKYKLFGFSELKSDSFLNIPYKHLTTGHSNLYLLKANKSKKINQFFNKQDLTGICGFEIKVKSLSTLNKLLGKTESITIEKNRTIVYLQDLNLFFVFTE